MGERGADYEKDNRAPLRKKCFFFGVAFEITFMLFYFLLRTSQSLIVIKDVYITYSIYGREN